MTKDSILEFDFIHGAREYQGGPYGLGGRAQLAAGGRPLTDDFEEIVDQMVQDELESVPLPNQFTENMVSERNQSDQFYRDLPGYPPPDTLVAPATFIPVDPSEKDQDLLGPTVGGARLVDINNDISDNTINAVNATVPSKMGKQTIDIDALVKNQHIPEGIVGTVPTTHGASQGSVWNPDQLVAPRDWQQELEDMRNGDEKAKLPLGGMGMVGHPIKHVPASAEELLVRKEVITHMTNNKNIQDLIESVIQEELEEAGLVGTDVTLQANKQVMDQILAKYGGDYQKASTSPEWAQALQQTGAATERDKLAHATGTPLPFQGKEPTQPKSTRLAGLRPSVQKQQQQSLAQQQQQQQQMARQKTSNYAAQLRAKKGLAQTESLKLNIKELREIIQEVIQECLKEHKNG